jgi:hypothetical protein
MIGWMTVQYYQYRLVKVIIIIITLYVLLAVEVLHRPHAFRQFPDKRHHNKCLAVLLSNLV